MKAVIVIVTVNSVKVTNHYQHHLHQQLPKEKGQINVSEVLDVLKEHIALQDKRHEENMKKQDEMHDEGMTEMK